MGSAGVKKGTDKLGVDNTPFASKTYNYTKQLMLALKVDAVVEEVIAEIEAGRHSVIALENTMGSALSDYSVGEEVDNPTFGACLLKGLDSVMKYSVKGSKGKEEHFQLSPSQLGPEAEQVYYALKEQILASSRDIFISPLDAIISKLHQKGYKVGEVTGRKTFLEASAKGGYIAG